MAIKNKIDILLTTYNQKKYIVDSLESILAQKTDFSWKLIVSDDGSGDGTREIIEKYQKKFPNKIELLPREKNQGRFKNLEKLMKAVNADYIALCAGDDYWLDEKKLQKQVDFLERNKDYSICYTRYREEQEKYGIYVIKPNSKEIFFESKTNIENFLKRWRIASSSMVFRSSSFKNFPYEKYQFLEDTHLVYYSMLQGKGKILNFVGTVYRIHEANVYASKDKITQMAINQKVFKDLYLVFPEDKVLAKRYNYLTFNLADYYFKNKKENEMKQYLQELVVLSPSFFLTLPFKFYSLAHRIIK